MNNGIIIEPLDTTPTFNGKFEIVERKGVGHPDTICDLLADHVSVELSQMYLKETGTIQHHNLDKALLVAGEAENRFGGGSVLKPMKLVLGDRATLSLDKHKLPVQDVVIKAADSWFGGNLRFVKKEHITYQIELHPAAKQLAGIFRNGRENIGANDTSALVGYAPPTPTEVSVLETEHFINSRSFKSKFPLSGEDVKVMGFRRNNRLELTVSVAFVDAFINSESDYFSRKQEILQAITDFHKSRGYFDDISIVLNNLDERGRGIDGLYLTVLGTSADSSDSGQVGRGNRVNGVISLNRPAGSEAAAGKNAVSHIGKIYNVMCFTIAEEIYRNVSGIQEVFVWMYNTIGSPIDRPQSVIVQPIPSKGKDVRSLSKSIIEIVEENLSGINDLSKRLMLGEIKIA